MYLKIRKISKSIVKRTLLRYLFRFTLIKEIKTRFKIYHIKQYIHISLKIGFKINHKKQYIYISPKLTEPTLETRVKRNIFYGVKH